MTYFHMGTPTLSSALNGFTSEFEMGSGGSRSLLPPGKPVVPHADEKLAKKFGKLIKEALNESILDSSERAAVKMRFSPCFKINDLRH